MKRTQFVNNLFALLLLILPFLAVFIFSGCAYHPKSAGKPMPPQWANIEGEYCAVDLRQATGQRKAMKLTAGLTAKGNTAICLGDGSTKKPQLVAIADSKECITRKGIKKANERFSNYVVRLASPDGAILKTVPEGSEVACVDDNKLAGGGSIGVYSPDKQAANDHRPVVALVVESRILTRMMMEAPTAEFPPDISAPLLTLPNMQCLLGDWHTNARYGVRHQGGVDDPDTLLVCDPDAPAAESVICQLEVTPGLSVGIVGNERANHIFPAVIPTACGAGNTLEVFPPNPDWDIVEFWIVGWGGSDTLSGIDDIETSNVIWGDYYCNPPSLDGEYIGTGQSDDIYGGPGDDRLYGEEGDDWIKGLEGSDHIYGNTACHNYYDIPDNDDLWGGPGNDRIYGDAPDDDFEAANDRIFGEAGDDTILGGPGNDEIHGDSFIFVETGGDDNLCGNAGADHIFVGPGCDDVFTDAEDTVHGQETCDFVVEDECIWDW